MIKNAAFGKLGPAKEDCRNNGIGFFVVVTGGSYVSTKAGSGSAERQVASPVLAQIEPTRAEEALRPRQHRPAPISRWLEAAN